ncbi:hypothetical protein [Tenuibacillus multivorans]|uniref:YneQ n=1 Tax=Tenuibacillus multivorans TaxID=237069 RepID=A0A1H0CIH8_9BACI|nr:hypothetical protein [Tenuibacillus multivorans]GEL76282.1 hypothetical protein TMU01_05170 [Tenuibacillus multivorans]SDN57699.1 hypothetical protein SAMN05216498_2552 [Tenuibacillus multivorans]
MAFGLKREELRAWKEKVERGEIAFITHYWLDDRFPNMKTVTKVGCQDLDKLIQWGKKYGLKPKWVHHDKKYPHYDLIGSFQVDILKAEGKLNQLERFKK